MSRNHSIELLLFVALGFVSCQTYRNIGIETYNPATITFPPEISTVMIVNNAAQQPDNEGHKNYYLFDKLFNDSDFAVSADSMAYHFCMALGKAMAETPLFDDVRLCEDTLRYDSLYFMSRPFSPNKVKTLCEAYDVDALITLDKLYFITTICNNLADYQNRHYSNLYYLSIEIIGEVRMVYPECQVAYAIPFTDSLIMSSNDDYFYLTNDETFTTQDVRDAMQALSDYTGHKMRTHFAPYWTEENRWYYTNIVAGWKRASAYATSEKWDAAAKEWQQLYGTASKWKQRARLASNLALCHEIKGDFQKAIEYAAIADSLFKKHVDDDDKYRKMQTEYLEQLKKRAEDDKTLSTQLKE